MAPVTVATIVVRKAITSELVSASRRGPLFQALM